MSFFIRKNKGSEVDGGEKKAKRRKFAVTDDRKKKKKPRLAPPKKRNANQGENISSDEDELLPDDRPDVPEDEILPSAQEKKLELAKKYLAEFEKQEMEKAEGSLDSKSIAARLRDEVLDQQGKLKRKVADKFETSISSDEIHVLRCKEHRLPITCVVVSSNGQHIYSGSKDSSIVKWSLETRKKLLAVPGQHKDKENPNLHSSSILSLAVSFDEKLLASGDEGKAILVWDPKTMKHLHTLNGHRDAVTGLAFCRWTSTLYSCSKDRSVKLWNTQEMGYIETLFGHQSTLTAIDALCKDRAVSSGGTDNSVRVWKITEESQLIYNGSSRSIDSVRRLDDQHFVSCSDDGQLNVWGVLKKRPLSSVRDAHGLNVSAGEPNWIVSVGCLPNSDVFASGSSDGAIRFWRISDNFREVSPLLSVPVVGFVNALAFCQDEKLVVGVGQEHRLGRWSRIKEAKNCILIINLRKKGNYNNAETSGS